MYLVVQLKQHQKGKLKKNWIVEVAMLEILQKGWEGSILPSKVVNIT